MSNDQFVPQFNLKVAGTQASSQVMYALYEVTVETSLTLPGMCLLRLFDHELDFMNAPTFDIGVKIEVLCGYAEQGQLTSIFKGEITGLEFELDASSRNTMVVRCYDRAHRLHRGRYIRAFVQVTDSDIVSTIGSEAGFTVVADSTTEVHDWLLQNNQTNWEFLMERAHRNGCQLFVTDEKQLHFQKVADDAQTSVDLTWGVNLHEFRPHLSAARQVDSVTVRGWDPKTKMPIVGQATTPAQVPQIGLPSPTATITSAFGAATMTVVDQPIQTQAEADALAQSICDDLGGSLVEAEGVCTGTPELQAGVLINIKNVGDRFSGTYYVTSCTHEYLEGDRGGYTTRFAVTGKRSNTFMGILHSEAAARRMPLGGNIVIGQVTDNNDPDNLGRVKVKYPWLTTEHTSFWVRQATPMTGPDRGFHFLPEVNDEVIVAFEHGDVTRPYILGSLWNGVDAPVEANNVAVVDQKVVHRTIKTRIGHTVLFDDTDGTGQMSMKTNAANTLVLDDKQKQILLKTTSGHTILLDDENSKIVVVDKTTSNKITINSSDNSIAAECVGDFSISAKGKVTITGLQGVEITSPAQIKMDGTAGVTVMTKAELALQGVIAASLKSATLVEIQGLLVKIN